ncbi:MAG: glucose-6-phosphate isomerase, partial [Panacagrimonas sp.]
MTALESSAAWADVLNHARAVGAQHLRALFAADCSRAQRFRAEACGLTLDYSKQRIDARAQDLLLKLAGERGFTAARACLFAGESINHTEQRAVLHVALRAPRGVAMRAAGQRVDSDVHAVLDRMQAFSARVRNGEWRGARGDTITDVVNIGIGGS